MSTHRQVPVYCDESLNRGGFDVQGGPWALREDAERLERILAKIRSLLVSAGCGFKRIESGAITLRHYTAFLRKVEEAGELKTEAILGDTVPYGSGRIISESTGERMLPAEAFDRGVHAKKEASDISLDLYKVAWMVRRRYAPNFHAAGR